MLHAPGIDGVHDEQAGRVRIEPRQEFFDEKLKQGRPGIAFDAMLAGGEYQEPRLGHQRIGCHPVNREACVAADGMTVQSGVGPEVLNSIKLLAKSRA